MIIKIHDCPCAENTVFLTQGKLSYKKDEVDLNLITNYSWQKNLIGSFRVDLLQMGVDQYGYVCPGAN